VIILLMGPAGSGKTTVGELLSAQLGWEFADGDVFHSLANIEKMSRDGKMGRAKAQRGSGLLRA
jgi:gluconokinase